MYFCKKYCLHLGVVGVCVVFGMTNFNLSHISLNIEDMYLKLGICVQNYEENPYYK